MFVSKMGQVGCLPIQVWQKKVRIQYCYWYDPGRTKLSDLQIDVGSFLIIC